MSGIQNIWLFVTGHWADIIVAISIIIGAIKSFKKYMSLSNEEKAEAALRIIKEELLKYMSDAEIDYEKYKKSGSLKRSQVLTKIYEQFPFLHTYVKQDEFVEKVYQMIDEEMERMKSILNNKANKVEEFKSSTEES